VRAQYDASHRPAAGALDAGEQLYLPGPAAAAVVTHPIENIADRQGRCAERASLNSRSWPHRSQVMRRNHDGNAANGSSRAPAGSGSGSLPYDRQWRCETGRAVTAGGDGLCRAARLPLAR
jgi:hypothetical protein